MPMWTFSLSILEARSYLVPGAGVSMPLKEFQEEIQCLNEDLRAFKMSLSCGLGQGLVHMAEFTLCLAHIPVVSASKSISRIRHSSYSNEEAFPGK